MKDYSKYNTDDFIADIDFIKWVIQADSGSNKYWNRVLRENIHQAAKINEAKKIIESLSVIEKPVSQQQLDKMFAYIQSEITIKRRSSLFLVWPWAAVALFLIGFGLSVLSYIYLPANKFAEQPNIISENAQIVLSDGSSKSFSRDESEIEVNTHGEIIVNNDTIQTQPEETEKSELNHVVMPYGKQSSLLLPDGTLVYVNAGTKFSFPSKFQGAKREVYLEGEALFDVAENKEKPFIVHTEEMDIFVTGTSFNVSAYNDDSFTQAVLVSGKVKVSKPGILNKKIEIKPGESALFNKESGDISTSQVDTEMFTAWTEGYMIFKAEPLTNVFKKLERFYNQEIVFMEHKLRERTFSGKLDIREEMESVLADISFATGLHVRKKEEKKSHFLVK